MDTAVDSACKAHRGSGPPKSMSSARGTNAATSEECRTARVLYRAELLPAESSRDIATADATTCRHLRSLVWAYHQQAEANGQSQRLHLTLPQMLATRFLLLRQASTRKPCRLCAKRPQGRREAIRHGNHSMKDGNHSMKHGTRSTKMAITNENGNRLTKMAVVSSAMLTHIGSQPILEHLH
jgi:hypothetical protein